MQKENSHTLWCDCSWWRQRSSNLLSDPLEAVARRNAQILQKRRTATPCGVTVLGGDNRTRICDLPRVRRTLYQLSYASIYVHPEGERPMVTRTGIEPVLPP